MANSNAIGWFDIYVNDLARALAERDEGLPGQ